MVLAKEMFRRSDFYKEIPNNMLLNVYITCIEREELIDAPYFEKQFIGFSICTKLLSI